MYVKCVERERLEEFTNSTAYNIMGIIRVRMLEEVHIANMLNTILVAA